MYVYLNAIPTLKQLKFKNVLLFFSDGGWLLDSMTIRSIRNFIVANHERVGSVLLQTVFVTNCD